MLINAFIGPTNQLTYTDFLRAVDQGRVVSVTIQSNGQVYGTLRGDTPFTTTIPVALAAISSSSASRRRARTTLRRPRISPRSWSRSSGSHPPWGRSDTRREAPCFWGEAQEVQFRTYAEETQRLIDKEVARLLQEAEERARKLLTEHRDELDPLTELLLEQETIDGEAVYQLVGKPMPQGRPPDRLAPGRA